ncbi:MAG: S-methyl-5'-thioadenosine phosphorylase [Anaerolineales bacterium]|jgi:5'-methylthioadenosine phosphorylase
MSGKPKVAVIGGSGLYAMAGLQDLEEHDLATPFGKPSDPLVVGTLSGQRVAFLARHGRGHRIMPGEVNYRANIFALKVLGVERVVSISACGSLREDYAPGDIVIPDQLIDHTHRREATFFGQGLVAHIGVAEPFCRELSAKLYDAVSSTGASVHKGGSLMVVEGPRFSTQAESNVYRQLGMSIIGMTTSPEAFLAREAEMCYAVMAHVTDYDVWHIEEAPVSVEMVIRILNQNTTIAQQAVSRLVASLSPDRTCSCADALKDAIITAREMIPEATKRDLAPLISRYVP